MEQEDLHQQFLSLNEYFNHLGAQLADASDGLLQDGLLPSQKLIDELVTASKDFDGFRSRLVAETQTLGLQPAPEFDDIHSLRDTEPLLHHISHAEKAKGEAEDVRRYALSLLTRVHRIEHAACASFTPLTDLHTTTDALHVAISNAPWSALPPDAHALADGSHPFSTLLTLVEQQAELDDDSWESLQDIVSQSFGRPMSIAAARGKLFLNEIASAEHIPHSNGTTQKTFVADDQADPDLWLPEDDALPIIPPEEIEAASSTVPPEPQIPSSPAAAFAWAMQRANDEESQGEEDHTAVARDELAQAPQCSDDGCSQGEKEETTEVAPSHADASEAAASVADNRFADDEDDLDNAPAIKQAVLDGFLKEQLDAVRKDVAGRQKQGFIKNIGRRMRQ